MASQSQSINKLIELIKGMSVIELADAIKEIETEFGVSAAASVAGTAAPAAGTAPAATEEKSEFKVTLQDVGSNKIGVIKALKAATTLTLSEAKEKVEGAPSVILEASPKQDAEKIKKELEAVGAKVVLS